MWVITKRKWIFTKIKGKALPRENVGYYQEKCNSLPRENALLPIDNVTHYQEEVWVITKRKCNSLPRGSVGDYQEEV